MAGSRRIKIGDVYQIPLPNGHFAFAQYVYLHSLMGYLVRVFYHIQETGDTIPSPEQLLASGQRFPPVFVGLVAAVRTGKWRRVGKFPVENFQFPVFRTTSAAKLGIRDDWQLWDGECYRFVGKLPEEYRSFEIRQVWGLGNLAARIVGGRKWEEEHEYWK